MRIETIHNSFVVIGTHYARIWVGKSDWAPNRSDFPRLAFGRASWLCGPTSGHGNKKMKRRQADPSEKKEAKVGLGERIGDRQSGIPGMA